MQDESKNINISTFLLISFLISDIARNVITTSWVVLEPRVERALQPRTFGCLSADVSFVHMYNVHRTY